jgi:exodeoxyribonuclease VII large subunit
MSEPASADAPIYTVGELLAGLRGLLEDRVGRLWLVGEVSNLRRPGSGHAYFTLKDDAGQIRAALFRATARALAFEPEDGLEVLVYGDVTVYEARGDLQVIVRHLEPRGAGALQVAFEQLRRRLEAEGLFDVARKRPLPATPSRVGIVASPTSAALRDVLQVTGRRCPGIPLLISPTRVRGVGAAEESASALGALGGASQLDLILLVRGGGSLEDLQAFNSEAVARAIARARVPVVSGVGHEVDVTIADLAADLRAPTPSAAAEHAVPDRESLRRSLGRDWRRLCQGMAAQLASVAARLERRRDAVAMLAPSARLAAQRGHLEHLSRALARSARVRLTRAAGDLAARAGRLETLSPLAVLGRGYALARRARDGAIVRRVGDAASGERLVLRVAEAELDAVVEAVRPLPGRG